MARSYSLLWTVRFEGATCAEIQSAVIHPMCPSSQAASASQHHIMVFGSAVENIIMLYRRTTLELEHAETSKTREQA